MLRSTLAIARARKYDDRDARVERAESQPGVDLIALYLKNGMIVAIPRELLQGLQQATLSQLRHIELLGPGTGLDWPDLDVQHSAEGSDERAPSVIVAGWPKFW